ncbi:hypothetical protein FB45DRAFT_1035263 [Roridomyces roridus]|uniref:Uncharacterized protein n=1 Tax=Roridomyces roridus TaxID=1738132 RepID=A0AAD7BC33_9AGAR|nr:hypothetical protein FB45DRAFT_1035263 [Roridomyces roridus]
MLGSELGASAKLRRCRRFDIRASTDPHHSLPTKPRIRWRHPSDSCVYGYMCYSSVINARRRCLLSLLFLPWYRTLASILWSHFGSLSLCTAGGDVGHLRATFYALFSVFLALQVPHIFDIGVSDASAPYTPATSSPRVRSPALSTSHWADVAGVTWSADFFPIPFVFTTRLCIPLNYAM